MPDLTPFCIVACKVVQHALAEAERAREQALLQMKDARQLVAASERENSKRVRAERAVTSHRLETLAKRHRTVLAREQRDFDGIAEQKCEQVAELRKVIAQKAGEVKVLKSENWRGKLQQWDALNDLNRQMSEAALTNANAVAELEAQLKVVASSAKKESNKLRRKASSVERKASGVEQLAKRRNEKLRDSKAIIKELRAELEDAVAARLELEEELAEMKAKLEVRASLPVS